MKCQIISLFNQNQIIKVKGLRVNLEHVDKSAHWKDFFQDNATDSRLLQSYLAQPIQEFEPRAGVKQ